MLKLAHSSIILVSLLFSLGSVSAANMPFTDVIPSDSYYSAVQDLYDNRIITDSGDHLFRPKELMARDFFVALSVQIGCRKCDTPSIDDIIRYQISPFVDLTKMNPHYYCIAYAKDASITQGYIIDSSGKATCENGTRYSSSPFCASNTITRIESTAILLRRAKLWDDTLNSTNFDRSLSIPDVTSYWYGYAKKGIDIGILKQQSDRKIGQDDKITRGEFATMAARILRYTMCQPADIGNTIAAEIGIRDVSGNLIEKSSFATGDIFSFVPITSSGSWDYSWTATDPTTGKVITGSGSSLAGSQLGSGYWIVRLDVIDPVTGRIVSSPSTSIGIGNITNSTTVGSGDPTLLLSADPFIRNIGTPVNFTAIVSGNYANQIYNWDYGDGMTSTSTGNMNHIYSKPGVYTVTLTVTDTITGKTAQSTVIMSITGDIDTDGDGTKDASDSCPLIYALTPTGCPFIATYIDRGVAVSPYSRVPSSNGGATIGIKNASGNLVEKSNFASGDIFSFVPITSSGSWDYSWTATDPTTGKVIIGSGSNLAGSRLGSGYWIVRLDVIDPVTGRIVSSPSTSISVGNGTSGSTPLSSTSLNNNICIDKKRRSQGLLIGTPNCMICPCDNSISINSALRSCDIVFPTILSPTLDTVYSRGGFYLIP